MNMTYLRVAYYFLSPILASLPGVTLHEYVVTIDLEQVAAGISLAGLTSGAIFAKWGKK